MNKMMFCDNFLYMLSWQCLNLVNVETLSKVLVFNLSDTVYILEWNAWLVF